MVLPGAVFCLGYTQSEPCTARAGHEIHDLGVQGMNHIPTHTVGILGSAKCVIEAAKQTRPEGQTMVFQQALLKSAACVPLPPLQHAHSILTFSPVQLTPLQVQIQLCESVLARTLGRLQSRITQEPCPPCSPEGTQSVTQHLAHRRHSIILGGFLNEHEFCIIIQAGA